MGEDKNIIDAIRSVVRDEIQPLREEFAEKWDAVLVSNDKLAGKLTRIDTELTALVGAEQRQDETLSDHENRLKRVEAKA